MNFFRIPSKLMSSCLYQKYTPLALFHSKTLVQERLFLTNKIGLLVNEKPLLLSSSSVFHHGLHSSTNNQEMSQNQKLIKQGLSVFKDVDLRKLKSAPFPALVYGFGGIIPFVFPPIYFILGSYSPFLVTSQLVYGATILAFVGGVKWGNAVAKNDVSHFQIGVSTIPSLIAWISILVPEPIGLLVVSTGLFGALYIDILSSNYPGWFSALRVTLTSVAVTSLLTSLMFYVLN